MNATRPIATAVVCLKVWRCMHMTVVIILVTIRIALSGSNGSSSSTCLDYLAALIMTATSNHVIIFGSPNYVSYFTTSVIVLLSIGTFLPTELDHWFLNSLRHNSHTKVSTVES